MISSLLPLGEVRPFAELTNRRNFWQVPDVLEDPLSGSVPRIGRPDGFGNMTSHQKTSLLLSLTTLGLTT